MEEQGQGWLRGAIIAVAVAAAGIYIVSRGDEAGQDDAADPITSTGRAALAALGSSEVGKRGGRIVEALLGNVNDQALDQVKSILKDAIRQLDQIADEL